jgi:hypothetical protein
MLINIYGTEAIHTYTYIRKQCNLPGQSSRLTVPKAWEIARTALIVFTTKGF